MYNSYRTGDDRWFFLVGVEAGRHLPRVLAAIGRPELLREERFGTARAISKNRREFLPILDAAFAAHPLAHWVEVFDEHDVWWAPVQTPAEVLDDPQARAAGAWVEIEGVRIEGRPVESVDSPVRFGGVTRTVVPGPPRAGQDTREVLAELGYDDAAIEALTADSGTG
jgi:crotonobetainyl-CoA:carnitine CoA-transferase CaiB-like acyl-CoA transferase